MSSSKDVTAFEVIKRIINLSYPDISLLEAQLHCFFHGLVTCHISNTELMSQCIAG